MGTDPKNEFDFAEFMSGGGWLVVVLGASLSGVAGSLVFWLATAYILLTVGVVAHWWITDRSSCEWHLSSSPANPTQHHLRFASKQPFRLGEYLKSGGLFLIALSLALSGVLGPAVFWLSIGCLSLAVIVFFLDWLGNHAQFRFLLNRRQ